MRKRAIFQGVLLMCLASVPGTQAVDSPSGIFFPWEMGAEWVYKTTHKEKKETFDMKVRIEGPWQGNDLSGMILLQKDKRGTMREFLVKNDKGIFIHKLGLSKAFTPEVMTRFTPPVPRVIFPLTPGTTVQWQGRLKVAWVDKPITFEGTVVGWEDIEVPAGQFKCIKLFYDQKRGEERVQESAWYAEGVGQVKYDGGQYVKELKSYRIK